MECYRQSLEGDSLARYVHKLKLIGDVDPYELNVKSMSSDIKDLPAVLYPDIVNYCLYKKSAFTLSELKSYKSLDAYNQFVSGWVSGVCSKAIGDKIIVRAKVCTDHLKKKSYFAQVVDMASLN